MVNFMLDGIQKAAFLGCKSSVQMPNKPGKIKTLDISRSLIRYADEFVILTNHERDLDLVDANIKAFLNLRGLQINLSKFTRHVIRAEGPTVSFNFLGFAFTYTPKVKLSRITNRRDIQGNTRTLVHPSRESILTFRRKLRPIINRNRNLSAIQLISKLNPILRKWEGYFGIGQCAKILSEVDNYIYRRL